MKHLLSIASLLFSRYAVAGLIPFMFIPRTDNVNVDVSSNNASANVVPSDGLAQVTIYVVPRDPATGAAYGTGKTVEITVDSANVTISGGSGACRTPSATCLKATDAGNGVYTITGVSSIVGTYNFSAVMAGTPDQVIPTVTSVTFDSSQFTTVSANTTITSSSPSGAAPNIYFTGGTATFDNTTVDRNFGVIFVRGGTLKHTATSTTAMYKLQFNATAFVLQSGSINVNGLGYPATYSFSTGGVPATAIGAAVTTAGGSHGGQGASTGAVSPTYDDYRNPSYPGAGGGSYSGGSPGGGVVRLTVTGACTINNGGTIVANGNTGGTGGAGGSIYLKCANFGGTAGASAITANGGNANVAGGTGGGGGGRIALISTGDSSSFSGSFAYTGASISTFKTKVKANGGVFSSSFYGGGAGTIYIMNTSLSYGDMIIDNNNQNYNANNKDTPLVSLAGTVNGAVSGAATMNITSPSPTLSAGYANVFAGMKLRPDVSFSNGTANDLSDDNVVTVSTNTATALTMTGNFSVANSSSFRSLDIFDHLEVSGNSIVTSYGDIYVLDGTLTSPGPNLNYTNAALSFNGNAAIKPTVSSYTFSSSTFALNSLVVTGAVTVSGATVTTTSGINASTLTVSTGSLTTQGVTTTSDATVSGGTLTATSMAVGGTLSVSSGTLTTQTMNVTGDFLVSGGTVNHPATTTTTMYSLSGTIGGVFTMNGGSINVNGLGYPATYSFSTGGVPATAIGAAVTTAGGSHGGQGASTGAVSPTYDDYRNPSYPGAGGGSYSGGSPGGGVVRLTVTGACTINNGGTIVANGNTGGTGGAGGSIYLKCANFGGTAGASAITANGGNANVAGGTGGGGGGRIALISTGDSTSFGGSFAYVGASASTFKTKVKANGGVFSSSFYGGGAGTIYIMNTSLSYGDMIIDNNNQNYNANNKDTPLVSLTGTVNGAVSGAVTMNITSPSPTLSAGYANVFAGMKLRPDVSFSNGTANDWTDDNVVTVSTNTSTALTMTGNFSVANSATFRSLDIFDHLEISGNATVSSYGDIYVLNGTVTSPGPTLSFTNVGLSFYGNASIYPSVSSYTYSSGTFGLTSVVTTGSVTVSGATVTTTSGMNVGTLTVSSGSLTTQGLTTTGDATVSGGTLTATSLNIGGNFLISGGTVNHPATTTTTMYSLSGTVAGTFTMNGGSINVNALGYPATYSFSTGGVPSTAIGQSYSNGGGSHGGQGGTLSVVSPTYDDYRNPQYPGGGSGNAGVGGGVVRLTVTGACTINNGASITANGAAAINGAAGGSIYLKCASFGGTAGASAITAVGGVATGNSGGGGGGGRIALISTGDANSFSGSFAYTGANISTFKTKVKANGAAYSGTFWGGGAGTIYIMNTSLTYGDMIIDNNNQTYHANNRNTPLVSLAGTVNGAVSGAATMNITSPSPALSAGYANVFAGMKVRPDVSFTNSTVNDLSDDNVVTVSTNTSTALTMTGNFSVANSSSFRSLDIFDHLEVSGNSIVTSYGDIYVLDGTLSSPGPTLNFTNGALSFSGNSLVSPSVNSYTFSNSATFALTTLAGATVTISGATVTTTSGTNVGTLTISSGGLTTQGVTTTGDTTLSGGALTATSMTVGGALNVSSGTLTTQTMNITGDFLVSGGTVNHPIATTTAMYAINGTIGGVFTMNGGSINVDGLGYPATYSFSTGGVPSTAIGQSYSNGGGSHGGQGGTLSVVSPTYDDYRNPQYPGGGSGNAGVGGGVVRLTVTGACTINNGASITANGAAAINGAAGGSIYLKCASFGGTAGASAITAVGGAATAASGGGGGGGRIALISTGDANSFSGSFAYTGANISTFKTKVKANGAAYSGTFWGGGAGTIYIMNTSLTYGDMIIDNNNQTYHANNRNTPLVSLTGTVSGAVSGAATMNITSPSPTLSAGYANVFAGMRLRPDVSFTNGTAGDWTDDNLVTVSTNTNTALTMTANFSVANSATFRSIDIFDHLEVSGNANITSYGDIYVLNGTLTSPGPNLSYTNSTITFSGNASISPAPNYTLSSGTYSSTSLIGSNVTVSGATLTTTSSLNLTSLTVSSGTVTTSNIITTGDFVMSGGTVTHAATTTGVMNSLSGTVGGVFTMDGGSINVNGLGYTSTYSYGTNGVPATALQSTNYAGGSHGGMGGVGSSGTAGVAFDDYRNPSYPGAGGAVSAGGIGGGVVRMTVTGACTVNSGGTITANGTAPGGAGGSIYLNCGSFAGTAGASAILAQGGTSAGTTTGGGGGGRIALISTGDSTSFGGNFAYTGANLSTFKGRVKANGGTATATIAGGGAGTIYIKNTSLIYGDLIIDNNTQTSNANNGKTRLVATNANTSLIYSSTATNLQITAASTPLANMTNLFMNYVLHVFPTASSANPLDASHYEATLTSNTTNNFVATAASFPAISGSNHYYRFVYKLDHLEISGNALVDMNTNGADLILMASSGACDLHSAGAAAFDVPAGSSLTGNSLASNYCSSAAKTGTITFTNTYIQP